MPNAAPPVRLQVTRAQLSQAFPNNPQMVLAMEQLLQTVATEVAGSTGDLMPFAGPTPPSGWLICDGSAVGRLVFANLYSVIGTIWGAGDGATTFNLPDLRDRTLMGASATKALGTVGGAASVVLTVAQLPAHNHAVTDPGHTHAVTDPGHNHTAYNSGTAELGLDSGQSGASSAAGNTGTATTGVTNQNATTGVTIQNTGNGAAVPTLSPYAAVNWLIKA